MCATTASGRDAKAGARRAAQPSMSRSSWAGAQNRPTSTSSSRRGGVAPRADAAASSASRSATLEADRPKWLGSPSPMLHRWSSWPACGNTQARPSLHCAVEPSHSSAPEEYIHEAMNPRRSSALAPVPASTTSRRLGAPPAPRQLNMPVTPEWTWSKSWLHHVAMPRRACSSSNIGSGSKQSALSDASSRIVFSDMIPEGGTGVQRLNGPSAR
eukprot:scaffold805_cov110-Isochrysis_galbana.AAC.6